MRPNTEWQPLFLTNGIVDFSLLDRNSHLSRHLLLWKSFTTATTTSTASWQSLGLTLRSFTGSLACGLRCTVTFVDPNVLLTYRMQIISAVAIQRCRVAT